MILKKINRDFSISDKIEITMEVNPDDVTEDYLRGLKASGVNRLSLGVQSFFEKDLKLMNRAHSADQAHKALSLAGKYFDNFSIFSNPDMFLELWKSILFVLSFLIRSFKLLSFSASS